jgi:predicted TIM-barrel fold metal-dependent hydrolase
MFDQITRRGLLGAGAAGAAALALPAVATADSETQCAGLVPGVAKAPPGGRIDLHAHHIPPVYRAALLRAGMVTIGGYPTPVWTPERALAFMDSYGIQLQMLSLSDPGVSFLKGDAAKMLARQVNEYTADLIRRYPKRFGGFAVLPLPDVAASLEELAYALDVFKLDGVALLTSYDGTNIAMPQFEALWAEINRRKAFVFMHPAALAAEDKPSTPLPDFFVEFTFETTRFCALALNTGLTTRYRDLRIQLAHAGGAFPFLNYRVGIIQNGAGQQLPVKNGESINGVLPAAQQRGFYYDTALNPAPAAMRSILEISDINHIVFGSDWPFTELLFVVPGDPQPPLSKTFNTDQRHAIERANPLVQLPSVAVRLGLPTSDTTVGAKLVRARVIRTKTGKRQVRFLLDAKETVLVDARLTRAGKTLAETRFSRVDRGRRSLRLTLPSDVRPGTARLVLDVTDAFGNTRTIRKTLRFTTAA